jgi:hypothetical protein
MPSPPSPRRLPAPPEGACRRGGRGAAAAVVLLAALLAGCGSARGPSGRNPAPSGPVGLALPHGDQAYLIDPLAGYSEIVDPGRRAQLADAYRALLSGGAGGIAGARRTAGELLAVDANLRPAQVLAAQADFVEGRDRAIVERLLPVGDALPNYTASQLLLGRAAERLEDVALAYAAYRAIAARSQLAFQRAGELHPRAVEIVSRRLQEALRRRALPAAEKDLSLLQAWAPAEGPTLEGARAVAAARGDRPAELAAIKGLATQRPGDRALLERRSELELEVGDPGVGLQIVQDLAGRHPDDARLAAKLAAAKFRWRLSLLPQDVRVLAEKPELTRADFAVLLYWLVPNVRYARPTAGRIATDVLDHPRQEEVVRVVNLGLMDVDPTLHRFSPASPLRRGTALRAVVRLLARFGDGKVSCLSDAAGPAEPSQGAACDAAARCGLTAAADGCDAAAALSGDDAVGFIQRSLELLGGA